MIYDVMDIQDVAVQLGVKMSTVKYYFKHDRMPPADVTFNGTPGWFRHTINNWRPNKAVWPMMAPEQEEAGYEQLALDYEHVESESEHAKYEVGEDEGYVIEYGHDESMGMADALEDMKAEFGELITEEVP